MKSVILILILLIIMIPNGLYAQGSKSVSGTIKWSSGTPALGVPVKLVKDGKVAAETYSNQAGKFIFRDLKGSLTDYKLVITPNNKYVYTIKDLKEGSLNRSITIR
jgi:hypothetical protein